MGPPEERHTAHARTTVLSIPGSAVAVADHVNETTSTNTIRTGDPVPLLWSCTPRPRRRLCESPPDGKVARMSSPSIDGKLPEWAEELRRRYLRGEASQFVV